MQQKAIPIDKHNSQVNDISIRGCTQSLHWIIKLVLRRWRFWGKTRNWRLLLKKERDISGAQRTLQYPGHKPFNGNNQPLDGLNNKYILIKINEQELWSVQKVPLVNTIASDFPTKCLLSTPALRGRMWEEVEQEKKMLICEMVFSSRTKRPPSSRQPPRSKAISQLLRQLVEGRRIQDATSTSSSSRSRLPWLSCKAFNWAPCFRSDHQMRGLWLG